MAELKLPATPERHHEKSRHGGSSVEDCWLCQRGRAICRSKRSYATYEAADVAVREVNEREAYVSPVTRYRCRWCLLWHLTTAKRWPQLRRMEKQRRKWLVAAGTSRQSSVDSSKGEADG